MPWQPPNSFPSHLMWHPNSIKASPGLALRSFRIISFHSSPLGHEALVSLSFLFSRHTPAEAGVLHPLCLPARTLFTRSEDGWPLSILPSTQRSPPLSLARLSKLTNSTSTLIPCRYYLLFERTVLFWSQQQSQSKIIFTVYFLKACLWLFLLTSLNTMRIGHASVLLSLCSQDLRTCHAAQIPSRVMESMNYWQWWVINPSKSEQGKIVPSFS